MSSNFKLQEFIHRLEEGNLATLVKLLALICVAVGVLLVVVFDPMGWNFFRGLSHEKGMEQALIARELAAGNGYTTKVIRPQAIHQVSQHLEAMGEGGNREELFRRVEKDTYHAPLWSVVLAPAMKVMQSNWQIDPRKPIYALDKTVAVVAILFLYGAVLVNFFTLRRLFDTRLAMVVSGVQLVTYPLWQYAMSGLPHMLLFFLFSATLWALVRAMTAKEEGKPTVGWLALVALFSGLMTITHYIALWPVLGLLIFVLIYFPSRVRNGAMIALVVVLMLAPWLYRNYQVSGEFGGLAKFSALHQVMGEENYVMRQGEGLMIYFNYFRPKIQANLTANIGNAFQNLGGWMAPFFFLTLLYPFRRAALRDLRWALLLMWLLAMLGMSIFQAEDITSGLNSSNLNLLFIPLFAAYGVAFIFTLWGGMNVRQKFFQTALTCVILLLAGLPFLSAILSKSYPVWWPPYAPPLMSYLQKWTKSDEVILSDMPWAVAWYGDRHSLWLPHSPKGFLDLYDYNRLGVPYGGMFLSPLTLGAGFMTDIVRGKYKEWAPIILPALQDRSNTAFPFSKMINFGPQGLCIFYSDFERWSPDEAEKLKELKDDDEPEDTGKKDEQKEAQ